MPESSAPPGRRPRFWRWGAALVVMAVVSAAGAAGVQRLRLAHERLAALRAAESGDLRTAEPVLRRVLQRRPDDVEAVAALARALHEAGSYTEAVPVLTTWVEARPDEREPRWLRMECLREIERNAEALADAQHLLAGSPDDRGLQRRVAQLLFTSGQVVEAERACRDYLARNEDDVGVTALLANMRRIEGDFAEAGALLDAALRRHGNAYGALVARAQVHLDAGEPAQALPLLERVVREDRRRQRGGRQLLAAAYQQAGRPQDAARVLGELRAMQEAEVLRDAADSQPENLELQVKAARAMFTVENADDALPRLSRVLERDPAFAPAHLTLAEYYGQVGRQDLAEHHRRLAGNVPGSDRRADEPPGAAGSVGSSPPPSSP